MEPQLDTVYAPSDEVVAREIEGETILVPLATDIGDAGDELYTLNDTGKEIWGHLDGHTTLRALAAALAAEYEAAEGEIERDVLGLVAELARRKMVVPVCGP